MKRIAAGALTRLLGFLSLRNVPTIEPTTACTAVSFPSVCTKTHFYSQVDLGAPYGRTVVKALPMSISTGERCVGKLHIPRT